MINLTEKQKSFLESEFKIKENDILGLGKEKWHEIREECVWIAADELMDHGENGDGEITEKCMIAESIAETSYRSVMGGSNG